MNYRDFILEVLVFDPPLFERSYYVLMLVLWMLVVEVSRIIARYGKIIIPLYINVHSILMTFVCTLTILYTVIYFYLTGTSSENIIQKVRVVFMFIMLGLILLQMGLGIVSRMSIFGFKYSPGKERVKAIHKYFGFFTILFCRIIISLKFVEETMLSNRGTAENERMKAWFFLFGGIYFIILILQFVYNSIVPVFVKRNLDRRKDTVPEEFPEEAIYHEVANEIMNGSSSQAIQAKYPNMRYVIFNNRIYDIEEFIHPGGQSVIEQVIGEEINIYISGGHSTYLNPLKHNHTIYVERYFSNKPSVLLKYQPIIIKKDLLEDDRILWKTKISSVFGESSTAMFNFSSETYHVKNYYQNLKEFGKYLILEAYTQSHQTIKRPYSLILSMTQQSIHYRKLIKQIYSNRANTNFISNINISQYSQTLPFIIKYYYGGELTSIIKNIPHNQYKISGPYGKGMMLYPKFQGHIVIITGGTGILPFLDLLDYIYRNLILTLLSKTFGDTQVQRLNPLNINYSMVSNITVKLYASFKNQYQFYGEQLLIDLYSLNKSINQEIFDMELRFSEGDYYGHGMKVKIDHILESTMRGIINSNPARVYVCGPPQMNHQIVEMFLDTGGNEEILCVL